MSKQKTEVKIRETIPAEKVRRAIDEMAKGIAKEIGSKTDDVALVGVHSRGVVIARRLAAALQSSLGVEIPVGEIDITLYRDDLGTSGIQPIVGETRLDFNLDDKRIILIDDVLFTGRTIRAAVDEIMDFGRPRSVVLAVLVDRGHRELPIAANVVGMTLSTKRNESVVLHLEESDKKEEIVICEA